MSASLYRSTAGAVVLALCVHAAVPLALPAQARAGGRSGAATPREVLDSLTYKPSWRVPDPRPTVAPLAGANRRVADVAARTFRGATVVFMEQSDSAGTIPVAAVGDTVLAFPQQQALYGPAAGGPAALRRYVVTARRRFVIPDDEIVECGMTQDDGWTYLLSGDTTGLHTPDGEPVRLLGIRAPFAWRTPVAAGAETRRAYRSAYRALAERATAAAIRTFVTPESGITARSVRKQVMGADGSAGWSGVTLWDVRGAGGVHLAVTSFGLNDGDLTDDRLGTERTLLVSASGKVLARSDVQFLIVTIVDLDGDGVDEILTDDGAIRYDGSRWIFPHHRDLSCD